jgi:hypothetical protein
VCWRTLACRVALSSATPWLAHLSQRRTGKRPPHRLHARPLPLRRRCCTLLRARALPSLYRRTESSTPSPPLCVGPCCPLAMHGYKGGHPLCLVHTSAMSASGKPSPSHSPLFLPLRRCQAASCAFRPRVQVPEHPPTLEKLPEAWPTSPTTGATRHHRRAPVRSATASPSFSDALPLTFSCRAGAWDSHDTMGEPLPIIGPFCARCRSCHSGALCAHRRVSREPRALPCVIQNTERLLHSVQPRWLVGCTSRLLVHAEQAACHMSRAAASLGPMPILARWPGNSKLHFLFSIWFQTEFKLQKFVSKYPELQKL